MEWLHVNSLVCKVQQAINTYERQDVLNFAIVWNQLFLTQLLNPGCVKNAVSHLPCEIVVLKNERVQIIFVGITFLLV